MSPLSLLIAQPDSLPRTAPFNDSLFLPHSILPAPPPSRNPRILPLEHTRSIPQHLLPLWGSTSQPSRPIRCLSSLLRTRSPSHILDYMPRTRVPWGSLSAQSLPIPSALASAISSALPALTCYQANLTILARLKTMQSRLPRPSPHHLVARIKHPHLPLLGQANILPTSRTHPCIFLPHRLDRTTPGIPRVPTLIPRPHCTRMAPAHINRHITPRRRLPQRMQLRPVHGGM
jgi:hypothetical protein